MRNSLIKSIREKKLQTTDQKTELRDALSQKLADKLVYRHLHKSRYSYTMSLFASEAGLSAAELSTSLEEILQMLNVSADSKAFAYVVSTMPMMALGEKLPEFGILLQKETLDTRNGEGASDLWILIKCLLKCFGADDGSLKPSCAVQTGSSVFDKTSALSFCMSGLCFCIGIH